MVEVQHGQTLFLKTMQSLDLGLYYAWIIKSIYFDEGSLKTKLVELHLPLASQAILAVGTLFFGVWAGIVFG